MNDFTDLSEAEQREAVEAYDRDRDAALKRGDLKCMVCSREAEKFENGDRRRPFCTRHMSPVAADAIPYNESGDPLFDGDEQEQQARIQAWR